MFRYQIMYYKYREKNRRGKKIMLFVISEVKKERKRIRKTD